MTIGKKILFYGILGGIYFLFLGFVQAKGVLVPLLTAIVLSLVLLPLSNQMEKKSLKRSYSSFFSVFLLFLISLGFMALISFQIQNFIESGPKIEETMEPKVEQLKSFVFKHTMFSEEDLEASTKRKNTLMDGNVESPGQHAYNFFTKTVGFFGNYLLTFIYIFFLLNYRQHFKNFMLQLFPSETNNEVNEVIHKVATVAQQYLVGKLMLMTLLAVLYSVGLGFSGVDHFILISIIAALLTLIPLIGNIIGLTLATVFGYLTTGEISVLIGIIATFTVAQFVESYILQPYVVGDRVNLHPFIVILAVIIGGALWGIPGMVLAIPLTGIMVLFFLKYPYYILLDFCLVKVEKTSK